MVGLFEFFQLWDAVHEMDLSQEVDHQIWQQDGSGVFSSKLAYKAFHNGATTFEPWKRLWKSWAPTKCKVCLSLAIQNRCWTADWLPKRGLPHPVQCSLGDLEDEDVRHLLTSWVFARQIWYKVLSTLGLEDLVPSRRTITFIEWWCKIIKRVPKSKRKGGKHIDS